MLLLLLSISIALAVSFLCSLAEAVVLSVNPLRLPVGGPREAARVREWIALKGNVERPITAILVLNTVAHTGGAVVAGSAFEQVFGGQWLWAFSITFMLSVLFGTEIVPKVLGVRFNTRLAVWIGPGLRWAVGALAPVIRFSEWIVGVVTRRLGHTRPAGADGTSHVTEIVMLTQAAAAERMLHSLEELIIIHAATLSARRVETVMIPRERIRWVTRHQLAAPNLSGLRHGFSRLPVADEADIDTLTGEIKTVDLLRGQAETRPLPRFGPRQNLTVVLQGLLQADTALGQVRDEAGRVVGLVARTDIVRLLLGGGTHGTNAGAETGEPVFAEDQPWKE